MLPGVFHFLVQDCTIIYLSLRQFPLHILSHLYSKPWNRGGLIIVLSPLTRYETEVQGAWTSPHRQSEGGRGGTCKCPPGSQCNVDFPMLCCTCLFHLLTCKACLCFFWFVSLQTFLSKGAWDPPFALQGDKNFPGDIGSSGALWRGKSRSSPPAAFQPSFIIFWRPSGGVGLGWRKDHNFNPFISPMSVWD